MSNLRVLLARWRRSRLAYRWTLAGLSLVVCLLLLVGSLFTIDVLFRLSILQRLLMLGASLAVISWTLRSLVLPRMRVRESNVDAALAVEQQHQIDNDLVAALQFTRADACQWGSRELRQHVIGQTAASVNQLHPHSGVSAPALSTWVLLVCLLVGVMASSWSLQAEHWRIFRQRLLLGNVDYPAQTTIDRVWINDRIAINTDGSARQVAVGYGQPVRWRIQASGKLPREGELLLSSTQETLNRKLVLQRSESVAQADQYETQLDGLTSSVQFRARVGDAATEVIDLVVNPLPVIELQFQVTPPQYARAGQRPQQFSGNRRLPVLRGSQVEMMIECQNGKRLKQVELELTHGTERQPVRCSPIAADRGHWRAVIEDTPLARVNESVAFEISVVDQHDLKPAEPLRGRIEVRNDAPPSCVVNAVHQLVVPTARPIVDYRVDDDYGIRKVVLEAVIQPSARQLATPPGVSGDPAQQEDPDRPLNHAITLFDAAEPLQTLPWESVVELDLADWSVAIGDRIEITVRVEDYRGAAPGAQQLSKPIRLQVADSVTVLSNILQRDPLADAELSESINRQEQVRPAPQQPHTTGNTNQDRQP